MKANKNPIVEPWLLFSGHQSGHHTVECDNVQNTVHFIFGHTSPYHLISTVSVKNWLLPIVVFKVCEKPLLLLIVKFRGNHFGHQIVHIICKPGNFPLVFNSEEFLVWKFVIHRNIISGPFQSRKVVCY